MKSAAPAGSRDHKDSKHSAASSSSSSSSSSSFSSDGLITASSLFYHNNRPLLDSFVVVKFSGFAKPLLKAIFASRELFGVLLNVVQSLATAKAKHQSKLA